ncbi:carbohydrate kinase, partial [Sistotremastrum niveocremeum HHB9708]
MSNDVGTDSESVPLEPNQNVMLIVVMGVSACGKSTIASELAKKLDIPEVEADELHPKSNIEKMSHGHPLTDEDREPWLELVRKRVEHVAAEQEHFEGRGKEGRKGVVVACSALKKYYRDILRGTEKPRSVPEHMDPPHPKLLPTYFVFISGSRDVLWDRISSRKGHFMKAAMLDSQLATLEDPTGEDGVVVVRLEDTTEVQVETAIEGLRKLGAAV